MIIKQNYSYTKINCIYHHEEPLNDYILEDIHHDDTFIFWDNYFTKLVTTLKHDDSNVITFTYMADYIKLLNKIKEKILELNIIPHIIINVYNNVIPDDIFLKYFTVIKKKI